MSVREIRRRNRFAYFKKCNKIKAKVSRFANGNFSIAAYISRTESWNDIFWVALQKSFHKTVGISGSRKLRRKSLMHPHNTWMSVSPMYGKVLPRMKRSWNIFTQLSDELTPVILNFLLSIVWFRVLSQRLDRFQLRSGLAFLSVRSRKYDFQLTIVIDERFLPHWCNGQLLLAPLAIHLVHNLRLNPLIPLQLVSQRCAVHKRY